MDQTNDTAETLTPQTVRHSILWRVIFYFATASIALSIVVSAALVVWNYEQQTEAFRERLEDIRVGYSESLGSSLWFYDEIQIQSQVKGIMNLEAISYVRVTDNLNINIEVGTRPHHSDIETLPIEFNGKPIGVLEIAFDRDAVIAKASRAAISTMIAQLVSLLLLASMLGVVVHTLINRRISEMAAQVNDRLSSNQYSPLAISTGKDKDEIDLLIQAFNALSEQMIDQLEQKTQAQQQLKTINLELEDRVKERTHNLQKTVDELNQTLAELHATQGKLIEAEKLSSLGGMVAGIAHEINTPLGLCITIHSYINDNYQVMKRAFDGGGMRKQDFVDFMGMMDESLGILDKNLQRAAHLIKSFKQVSEDQTGEHIRRFSLHDYLHEIMETLSPKFKQTQHKVEIDCSENLWMETFAGSISQVVTNLVMNSLVHAFEHTKEGLIRIQAAEEKGNIVIRYTDNGCGLSAEAKHKIFEPFYTTKRGQGGTGLGMHLVYNIVHQRLKGEIQVEEADQGAAFRMVIPKITEESNVQ
ncbi:ATP-binding protein [Thalassolituus sp. LLYu03]|uniref:sensor histidine kinase n=1 Tax=Thalassolituus sp. LLYu03 TaxID=3421656 RepID=UPI003D2A475D